MARHARPTPAEWGAPVLLKNAANATPLKYLRLEVDRIVDCGAASNPWHTYDLARLHRHAHWLDQPSSATGHGLPARRPPSPHSPTWRLPTTSDRYHTPPSHRMDLPTALHATQRRAAVARGDSLMGCLTASRSDGAPALLPEMCRQMAAGPWRQCAGEPAPPLGAFSHWQS